MAKIKITLDTRKNRIKKDGTYPVVLKLSHKNDTARIGLKYYFTLKHWDEETNSPIGVPNYKHIAAKFRSQHSKGEMLLSKLQMELETLTLRELKAMVEAEVFAEDGTTPLQKSRYVDRKTNQASIIDYGNKKIARLRKANLHGNAVSVNTALKSFQTYTGKDDIEFSTVNITFLKDYCAYCYSRNNKPNTIGAYLRQIKALFNEAIEEGVIDERIYPFKKFKIPKSPKTKNRALRMSEIDAIRELEIKPNSAMWKARNYFLFMFNNMGINFMDLAKLKKSQFNKTEYDQNGKLIAGRISYRRSKTQGSFSIKLTAESLEILNHYDIQNKEDKDFIFPLHFENSEQGRKRYQQQRKRVNRQIREMAKLAGIDEEVTTYYARHSWATIAKRKNMPVALISEGLGHSDLKTTQIYLASFDDDALDDANEAIVG